jgi:hypothetical protein
MKGIQDNLTNSFIEFKKDPNYRVQHELVVDAAMEELKAIRPNSPITPQFKSFLKKSPEEAARMFEEAGKAGVSPAAFLQMAHDPLMLMTGITSMQAANREMRKRAAGTEGDGGGSSAAPTPASPSQSGGGGAGITLGGVKSPTGINGPADGGAQPATQPQAAPDQQQQDPNQDTISSERQRLQQFIVQKERQLNSLRNEGVAEKDLAAHVGELSQARKDLRDLTTKLPLEAGSKALDVVSPAEISQAVDMLKKAGRKDIADRLKIGIRRGAFDGLMQQVGPTQTTATPSANVPASSSPSPTQPAATSRQGDTFSLVQTPAEAEQEKLRVQRREATLPETLRREPNLQSKGIQTQGQYEDAQGTTVRTPAQQEQDKSNATVNAQQHGKMLEQINLKADSSRDRVVQYDTMAAAALRFGPSGPWVTPIRKTLGTLLQTAGLVSNPSALTDTALMEKANTHLAVELTNAMKGQQSNKELSAAVGANPGAFQTPEGMAILIAVGREVAMQDLAKQQQAHKWMAENGGSLLNQDKYGRSFSEVWDKSLNDYYAKNGSIQDRVAEYYNSDPASILKGKLKPRKK